MIKYILALAMVCTPSVLHSQVPAIINAKVVLGPDVPPKAASHIAAVTSLLVGETQLNGTLPCKSGEMINIVAMNNKDVMVLAGKYRCQNEIKLTIEATIIFLMKLNIGNLEIVAKSSPEEFARAVISCAQYEKWASHFKQNLELDSIEASHSSFSASMMMTCTDQVLTALLKGSSKKDLPVTHNADPTYAVYRFKNGIVENCFEYANSDKGVTEEIKKTCGDPSLKITCVIQDNTKCSVVGAKTQCNRTPGAPNLPYRNVYYQNVDGWPSSFTKEQCTGESSQSQGILRIIADRLRKISRSFKCFFSRRNCD